jgi:hypothetical protein
MKTIAALRCRYCGREFVAIIDSCDVCMECSQAQLFLSRMSPEAIARLIAEIKR